MRVIAIVITATLVIVMSLGVDTPAVAGSTATSPCEEPLNLDRQAVYRFKNGDKILSFGKVVVTPTKADRHRFCEQFRVGGKYVKYAYKRTDFERPKSACSSEMFRIAAAGPYEVSDFRQSLRVPAEACTFQKFSIKWNGKWWTARVMRQRA